MVSIFTLNSSPFSFKYYSLQFINLVTSSGTFTPPFSLACGSKRSHSFSLNDPLCLTCNIICLLWVSSLHVYVSSTTNENDSSYFLQTFLFIGGGGGAAKLIFLKEHKMQCLTKKCLHIIQVGGKNLHFNVLLDLRRGCKERIAQGASLPYCTPTHLPPFPGITHMKLL